MRRRFDGWKRWVLRGAVIALIALLIPSGAHAYWHSSKKIVHNTSYSLESGEKLLGLFTPLGYGLNDWITFYLHPILLMLVTPNFNLRLTVFNGVVGIAVHLGYSETFLDFKSRNYPGIVETGLRVSAPLGKHFMLTTGLDYQLELFPNGSEGSVTAHHLLVILGMNVLINRSNMITLSANFGLNVGQRSFNIPTGTLLYAHSWETFRLGVGVAFGRFLFQTREDKFSKLYAYPILDAWWRWF